MEPEPEPPTRRRLADDQEDQHRRKTAEEPFQREHFGFVGQPTAPPLDREAVVERDPVRVDPQRKIEQMKDEEATGIRS